MLARFRKPDLVDGSVAEGLVALSVPAIAASLLQSLQSVVDMFFVGRLGPDALAAVGMSGSALMFLLTVFMGLDVAGSAMVARAVGARDAERSSHVAGQSVVLTLLLSVLIGTSGYALAPAILRALGSDEEVARIGTGYLRVTFPCVFLLCAAFIGSGILRAAGDAVTPLLLGILTTVCNIILTPLLIFGKMGLPRLGVPGSAAATVISQAISFAVCATLLIRGRLAVRLRWRDLAPDWKTIWRMTVIGVPGSLQMSLRTVMNLVLMAIVAQFGTTVVAAYSVGLRLRMIGMLPFFCLGGAAATMVGQNLGAGRPERSAASAYTAAVLAFASGCAAAAVFVILSHPLIGVFNERPDVIQAGADFLRLTALGLLTAAVGIVVSRALNGAGDTVGPLVITLVCLWGFQIPAAIYLSGVRTMWGVNVPGRALFSAIATNNEHGVWHAMVAASTLQAAVALAWFATGRWKSKRV